VRRGFVAALATVLLLDAVGLVWGHVLRKWRRQRTECSGDGGVEDGPN